MSNPNRHSGSSIMNEVDRLATMGLRTVSSDGPMSIQPGETPSQWAARIKESA